MIGRLTGRIARRQPTEILLDVGGVGYRVAIPLSTFCALPADGEAARLEIHTVVRDDAILLFGFSTYEEKALFEALLSVSGVGPKVGLAILSGLAPEEIVRAVEAGDAPRLKSIPGVGRKLAERIVLELKERIGKVGVGVGGAKRLEPLAGGGREAESALVHLGYAPAEAREAVEHVQRQRGEAALPLETLLREALRILSQ
jgi:Holliday junction DNA helicase RuvA